MKATKQAKFVLGISICEEYYPFLKITRVALQTGRFSVQHLTIFAYLFSLSLLFFPREKRLVLFHHFIENIFRLPAKWLDFHKRKRTQHVSIVQLRQNKMVHKHAYKLVHKHRYKMVHKHPYKMVHKLNVWNGWNEIFWVKDP